jgi:hydroxypyruvate reductase
VDWLKSISPQEDLIVLLSGGTSALFELPKPGNTLEDIIALNSLLLKSGLDISQINAKRKETSQVKRGKCSQVFLWQKVVCVFAERCVGE